MSIPVINPVGEAFNRTGLVLFRPFNIGKWFTLGFCAFLAILGNTAGSVSGNFTSRISGTKRWPSGSGSAGSFVQQAISWINHNLGMVVLVGSAILFILLLFSALILWLQGRGKFMFIDGIVLNRGAVVEPWHAFRRLGNSLFGFTYIFYILIVFLNISFLVAGFLIALPDIKNGSFGKASVVGIVVGGTLLLVVVVISSVVSFLLYQIVVPAMYLRDEGVFSAWRTVRTEVLPGNIGSIILFALMRIVLSMVISTLALIAVCLTCCLAALPYIGVVILLPFYVFMQSYTLCFLEGLGPGWRFFYDGPICPGCGYDLRATPPGERCPECGRVRLAGSDGLESTENPSIPPQADS